MDLSVTEGALIHGMSPDDVQDVPVSRCLRRPREWRKLERGCGAELKPPEGAPAACLTIDRFGEMRTQHAHGHVTSAARYRAYYLVLMADQHQLSS